MWQTTAPGSRQETESTIRNLSALLQGPRVGKLRKPNLIGVGSGRCGTSFLFGLLDGAPDVYVTPIKEANYFGIRQQPFQRDGMTPREYALLFASQRDERFISEITPVYLSHPVALRLMRSELGPIKIIINLRNPVSRLRSHFLYHRGMHGFDDLDAYTIAAMDRYVPETYNMQWNAPDMALRMSRYAGGVGSAVELFGRENVLVLLYEELRAGGVTWIDQLEQFLGIVLPKSENRKFQNENKESGADFAPQTRQRLSRIFHDDVERLSKILGRDFQALWNLQ